MESRCSFTRSHSTSVMATAFAFSIRGRSGQLLRSGAQGPSRDSKGHSFARYGARFHGDEIGISGSASQSDCQPGIGSPIHNASWQNAAQCLCARPSRSAVGVAAIQRHCVTDRDIFARRSHIGLPPGRVSAESIWMASGPPSPLNAQGLLQIITDEIPPGSACWRDALSGLPCGFSRGEPGKSRARNQRLIGQHGQRAKPASHNTTDEMRPE